MSLNRTSLLALCPLLGACATLSTEADDYRTLAADCDDIVVVGRIKNGEYEPVEIENDILGHGWVTAEIRVRSVEKGRSLRPRLPVRYLTHAEMREDSDFMFVLSPESGGRYGLKTAQLMSYRPRWVNRCDRNGEAPAEI